MASESTDLSREKTSEIRLLNQKIVLKSDSDPSVVKEAIGLAELKIRDAEVRGKGQAAHHIALMALLDLAEEYVRAKRRAADLRKRLSGKTEQLSKLVDGEAR